jgi:hypothetical protein
MALQWRAEKDMLRMNGGKNTNFAHTIGVN